MARIPVLEEKQRLEYGGANRISDTSADALRGKAIADAGLAIGDFAVKMAKLDEISKRTDDAAIKAKFTNDAHVIAIQTLDSYRSDKTVAADGSDVVPRWGTAFSPLMDAAEGIQDSRRRRVAKMAVDSVMKSPSYLSKVFDTRATMKNENLLSTIETSIQGANVNIMQNPSIYYETRAELLQLAGESDLGPSERIKVEKVIRQQTSDALVRGFQEREDFETARVLLNGTVGADFSQDELAKRLDNNARRELQLRELNIKNEERNRRAAERQEKEDRETLEHSLFEKMYASETSDQRKAVVKEAMEAVGSRQLTPSFIDTLNKHDKVVLDTLSDASEYHFYNRLYDKKNLNTFQKDVRAAAGETLTFDAATRLQNQYKAMIKVRKNGDRFYSKEEKNAYDFLQAEFAKDSFLAKFNQLKDREMAGMKAKVIEKMIAYQRNKVPPLDAAVRALKDFGIDANLPPAQIPGISKDAQQDSKKLQDEARKLHLKHMEKVTSGKATEADKRKVTEQMRLIQQRLKNIRNIRPESRLPEKKVK